MRQTRSMVWSAAAAAGLCGTAVAQCNVLIYEDFHLGMRPRSNSQIRDAQVHTGLDSFWATQPNLAAVRWIAPEVPGVQAFYFAASSTDPSELPEPPESYNGTAFAGHRAAAVVPFTPPSQPFTISADVVMLQLTTDGVIVGFTSSSVGADNFKSHGNLWARVDGWGNYEIHADGSPTPVASGYSGPGLLASGWTNITLTLDPATSTLTGSIGGVDLGSIPVFVGGTIGFAGMEIDSPFSGWGVVNNFIVRSGDPTRVSQSPSDARGCANGGAVFHVAGTGAETYLWRMDGSPLTDGVQNGVTISGAATDTLTLSGLRDGASGAFDCALIGRCGVALSAPASLTVCGADLDCTTLVDDSDFVLFSTAYDILDCGDLSMPAGCPADMNRDLTVDDSDFVLFAIAYDRLVCP